MTLMQRVAAPSANVPASVQHGSLQSLKVLDRSCDSNSLLPSSICKERTAVKIVSRFPKRKVAAAAIQFPCGELQESRRSSSSASGSAEIRLGWIWDVYADVGEYEKRQAEKYVAIAEAEGGRRAEDYERRAFLYGRSGEMGAASKRKRDKVAEEMEEALLCCDNSLAYLMMEEEGEGDKGKSPADYQRRALFFTKTAQVFGPSSL